jgi:aspartyl-tRNA(Asn)/glutamyl-tRNA(Gln) amidotransferase subunit A
MPLHEKSLAEIKALMASGEVSVLEAVEDCLARIEATEPRLGAMLKVTADEARRAAGELDDAGPDPDKPLWGVPVAVKDVICVKGVPNTCGSRILENFRPFYDAFAVKRLKQAGAVILGKTNMDEFAMGSSTENSAYFPTRNPWDTERVPGGSSGGSAASVAARQCFGALGTDTGGSIRQPASFCGVYGLKPTYGRVSRFGCVAYGSSLDQIGPIAGSVEDLALMLQVIAGFDPMDSTCADLPVPDYSAALSARDGLQGLRLGMPEEYWGGEGLAEEVKEVCAAAVSRAEELGAEVVPVSLPHTRYGIAAYYIVVMAEASSNLARYDGVRYGHRAGDAEELIEMYVKSRSRGFGDEVQRRIMLGTYVLSAGYYDAYYRKAAKVRRLVQKDYQEAFEKCDLLVGPASPVAPWKIGEIAEDPLQMYMMDIFTLPANMAGLPGLSMPAGMSRDSNMPVGLQLLGPAFSEDRLLAFGQALSHAIEPLGPPRGL